MQNVEDHKTVVVRGTCPSSLPKTEENYVGSGEKEVCKPENKTARTVTENADD